MMAIQALVVLGGLLSAFIVVLVALRRIPRAPAPDDVDKLRSEFADLCDQFRVFVQQHDVEMGRYHAKVQHLRRKLMRAESEDALEDEDEEQGELPLAPVQQVPLTKDDLRRRAGLIPPTLVSTPGSTS